MTIQTLTTVSCTGTSNLGRRRIFTGFWYILLFLIGIVLFVFGITRKSVSKDVRIVILLLIFGVLFVLGALILLLPGSSDILSTLFGF